MNPKLKRVLKNSFVGPLLNAAYRFRMSTEERQAAVFNDIYDKQAVEVMLRVLKPESNCIDIGANIGMILQRMTKIAPIGNHFAFEPIPELAQNLRESFPAVTIIEAAASNEAGYSEFNVAEVSGFSGLREISRGGGGGGAAKNRKIRVKLVLIDDVIKHDVALMKIDVEGAELAVLQGAKNTISRCRPIILFEAGRLGSSVYGVDEKDFYSFFTEVGYQVSTMERWLSGGPSYSLSEFTNNWQHGKEFCFIAW